MTIEELQDLAGGELTKTPHNAKESTDTMTGCAHKLNEVTDTLTDTAHTAKEFTDATTASAPKLPVEKSLTTSMYVTHPTEASLIHKLNSVTSGLPVYIIYGYGKQSISLFPYTFL